jgi:coenzyme Q-binding protein COQ10
MAGAEKSIVINAPPDVVYAVIVDYEKYPQFLDDVTAVKIVERGQGFTVLEQTLNLVKEVVVRLRLVETPNTSVRWTSQPGGSSLVKRNDGGWKLEDLGNGTTKATYGLEVEVGMWVPQKIVDSLTGGTLPKTLEAFKKRAEARK